MAKPLFQAPQGPAPSCARMFRASWGRSPSFLRLGAFSPDPSTAHTHRRAGQAFVPGDFLQVFPLSFRCSLWDLCH